uniref:Uncharacterized protein TCIL3000_7_770 n=1 Tax=Trypanosoma congolense (strain IL3000) TaxID=1068625 RepID=G0UPG5_TRYCI|nr:unnamed protein product [Trypanosoma congolense IL3000]
MGNRQTQGILYCPECGLKTPFCASTGKRHTFLRKRAGAEKDGDSEKSTVRSTPPSQRRKVTQSPDGEGSQSSVIVVGAPQMRGRQKGAPGKTTKNKTAKEEEPQQLRSEGDGENTENDLLMNRILSSPASRLRSPLSARDAKAALRILDGIMMNLTVICSPFASVLHEKLQRPANMKPQIMRKKTVAALRGKGTGSTGNQQDSSTVDDNTEVQEQQHFLDILGKCNSNVRKRFLKFIHMYTSEGAKVELLKKKITETAAEVTTDASQ